MDILVKKYDILQICLGFVPFNLIYLLQKHIFHDFHDFLIDDNLAIMMHMINLQNSKVRRCYISV